MRNRVRKTNRGQYSKDQMQMAIAAVLQSNQSIRESARVNGVNYKTLGRYVKLYQSKGNLDCVGYKGVRQIFNDDLEILLVDYIKKAAQIYHGLTPLNIRELAFKLASQNNLQIPPRWNKDKIAGVDWFKGFMKRQPRLSIREPEPTSLARMTNFNRSSVNLFFDNLAEVMSRGSGYGPQSIYNIDETGIVTVQKPCKIVAERGAKQVGATVSQERGSLVTLCCGVNAIGNAIPPFFVFPRVNFQSQWLATAPPGSAATGHPKATGWMTSENFLEFMKHFELHTKPTADHPILLILDNHSSHISIDVLDYAKDHYITILSFPPHCSHALQPLDRSVFGPLKTYINQAMDNWMRDPQNANKSMTVHVLPSMVSYAFPKAFTPANITSGFRCTGIYPFDRSIFTDIDFMPSLVSDRPLLPNDDHKTVVSQLEAEKDATLATPETYHTVQSLVVSPEEIRPFPRATVRDKSKKPRKVGKSAVYTDTPVKNEVANQTLKKTLKSRIKTKNSDKGARRNLMKKFRAKENQLKISKDGSSDVSDEELFQEMEQELEKSDEDVSDGGSYENSYPSVKKLHVNDHILVKFTGIFAKFYFVLN